MLCYVTCGGGATMNSARAVASRPCNVVHFLGQLPLVSVNAGRRLALLSVQRLTPLVQSHQLHPVPHLRLDVPASAAKFHEIFSA